MLAIYTHPEEEWGKGSGSLICSLYPIILYYGIASAQTGQMQSPCLVGLPRALPRGRMPVHDYYRVGFLCRR